MPCECCQNNAIGGFRDVLKDTPFICENVTEFKRPIPKHFSTLAIHAGQEPELWNTLSVTPQLVTSAVYKQLKPGEKSGYERPSNPSRAVLENCISSLYNSKYCFCFSSGMSAISACMALVRCGEHIICGDDLYGGTIMLMNNIASSFGINVTYVDPTDVGSFERKIKNNTRLIFVETPSNPCMKLTDIEAVAKIAKKRKVYFAVDNTTTTPYLQNPLELGATIVVDSLTKYMNGHYDCLAGAINTNDETVAKKIKFLQVNMGAAVAPFDAYLINRGLKTLVVRLKQQIKNTMAVAKFLEGHKRVTKVLYPGLPSHPQYELAKKQMSGSAGLISFYIKGSDEDCKRFVRNLKFFPLCVSFGGFQSLINVPSLMTHAFVPIEQREKNGITGKLIRLAIGIENTEDLLEDLDTGLNKLGAAVGCCN